MRRLGRIRTAAAFTAAAGLAVALVVVRTGGDHWDPLLASGTVGLEPTLVAPRHPSTAQSASTGEPTIIPRASIERAGRGGSTNATSRKPGVRVGSVGGLYPGRRVALRVRYLNPYSFPIAIHKVRVRARGTALCTARHLMRPKTPRRPVRVPSRSSVASKIKVGMRRSAPDACQGVRFAVRVRVTAVKL
jgi:hypothetical protein